MITPSSRRVNPYAGNPYLYGGGAEHNWFIDERGNVIPAPSAPAPLPLPSGPEQEVVPSLFEGDGARGGEAYERGGLPTQDTWPDMTGPALGNVLAALAAERQGQYSDDMMAGYGPVASRGPDPQMGQSMQSEPPAGWGEVAQPGSYSDDMMSNVASLEIDPMMAANMAAEEQARGSTPSFTTSTQEEPPAAPGVSVGQQGQNFSVSGPIGIGGLVGSIGTNAGGWGATIGGNAPGSAAALADFIAGNMGPGSSSGISPSEFANSPAGRAAMDFMEGLLSRSPDEFNTFGERATVGGNRATIAGTLDQLRGYVDPSITFGAPPADPLLGAPAPGAYNPEEPMYTPGQTIEAPPAASFLDLLDLEKTPVFDQETLTPAVNSEPLFSFSEPEVISTETGALALPGVDEDMFGTSTGDMLQTGSGDDRPGLSADKAQEMYNEPNLAVGAPGMLGGTLIGDLQTALAIADRANVGRQGGQGHFETRAGYDPQIGGYFVGETQVHDKGNEGRAGNNPGQDQNGGQGAGGTDGSTGSNNGQDAATSPDQDSTGGTGAGGTGANSGGAGGGCYLTTAAVDHMGLPDNGPHLQTLRWYRDKVMRRTPEGRRMIAEYNRVAPKAVKALNGRSDSKELYRAIFSGYIDPAAAAISAGEYDKADKIYGTMVKNVADITGVK